MEILEQMQWNNPWTHSPLFSAMRAAKAWNMSPDQFREESEDGRAYMMAVTIAEGAMQAYEESQRNKPA